MQCGSSVRDLSLAACKFANAPNAQPGSHSVVAPDGARALCTALTAAARLHTRKPGESGNEGKRPKARQEQVGSQFTLNNC